MLKVARLSGLLTSIGVLGLYLVFVFFNPYRPGSLTLPIVAMMVLALVGALAAWWAKPYLMLAIFLVTFVPVGLYMLGTPGLFKWIGILQLVFLLASILMAVEPVVLKWRRKPNWR